jgi:pyruvate,water dikinase
LKNQFFLKVFRLRRNPFNRSLNDIRKYIKVKSADMKRPKLYLNIGFPDTIEKHKEKMIDGIGLFRIEFMIATYVGKHPAYLIDDGKSDQYIKQITKGIIKVTKEVYPKPVVVRFSDFKTNEYRDLLGGTKYETKEQNPMMGWRGASRFVSKKFNKIFRAEIQAAINIRQKYDNLWVMIPFIRNVEEAKECLEIMKEEGLERNKKFQIWLMAETPSIPLLIDDYNKLPIDGYSIGSNDLCQFILAVDRDNADLLHMGYFNEENPAVLKAIEIIIKGAHKSGKTCSICGDSVSNSYLMVDHVLEFGIDSLSLNVDSFNKVHRYINSRIFPKENNFNIE